MNETTIPAQVLYDLRETYAFTDGKTLSAFFARETGDPFTVGSALIRMAASRAFEAWEQALDGLPEAEVLKQAIVGLHSTIEFWQSRDQHRPLHDMHLMLAELLVEQ